MINEFDAAEELIKRRKARTSLAAFSEYINPDEPPAHHHRVLCDALDEVANGTLRRLMVFMPPGMAKSTYSSVMFPAYFLGRFPKKNIICGAYGEKLPQKFGRKVRNMLKGKSYGLLFETRLSEDSQSKGEWETQEEGSYFACGVGSGVTGRRADLLVIDDPIKGRKDADSELVRNDTWDWYISDAFSRLKPGGAQIFIQTRWHEDDPSGRILPPEWNGESGDFVGFDGETWKVICLPAEARENDILGRKPGEWLWTEWCPPEEWERTKRVQTAKDVRNWNCLYQQIPQPETGVFFQREWFNRFNLGEEPKLTKYAASDCAVTNNGGDFTEHGIGGFDSSENLWFVDWWSGQVTMDVWIESMLRMASRHNPISWAAESGVIKRASEPYLIKAKREKKVYFHTEWLPSMGDKAANSQGFRALASDGKVYIPRTEWGDELINQLVKFIPNTNFRDDKVDVCGLFGRILNRTFGARLTVVEKPKQRDSYGLNEEVNSWKTA
jgi:predicted phage terminase large subunit-like protein